MLTRSQAQVSLVLIAAAIAVAALGCSGTAALIPGGGDELARVAALEERVQDDFGAPLTAGADASLDELLSRLGDLLDDRLNSSASAAAGATDATRVPSGETVAAFARAEAEVTEVRLVALEDTVQRLDRENANAFLGVTVTGFGIVLGLTVSLLSVVYLVRRERTASR